MLSWSRRKAKAPSPISQMKCLPTLCLPMTFPTRIPILSLSFSRPAATEALIFSRSASVAASNDSRLSRRVPAAHQPLAGIIRMGDLGEVLLIEQGQLQRAAVSGQDGDVRGLQRGDPPGARQ